MSGAPEQVKKSGGGILDSMFGGFIELFGGAIGGLLDVASKI